MVQLQIPSISQVQTFFGKIFQRNILIYLVSNVLNSLIPFFLIPVLTHYLKPEEYGTIAIYMLIISFATPFISINLGTNISRHFFKQSHDETGKLISNLMIILSCNIILSFIALIIYFSYFENLLDIPKYLTFTIPIVIFTNTIINFNLLLLRTQGQAVKYGLYQISRTFIDLGLSIMLVIAVLQSWVGRPIGNLAASVIIAIICTIHMYQAGWIKFNFSKEKIKDILKISLPMIPYAVGFLIISVSNRFFLDRMVSKSAVGIFSVGYSFASIMLFLSTAFLNDWSPWFYKQLAKEDPAIKIQIVKKSYLYYGGLILLALAITGVSYFLVDVMTAKAYHECKDVIIWLALGLAFQAMYQIAGIYFIHLGKTSYLAKISIAVALLNLGLNYLLIKMNGIVGAAQATLISYFLTFIITFWYANQVYPMPWNLKKT